jgi:aminopeptidase N
MERSPWGAGRAGRARALARAVALACLVAVGAPAGAHAGRAPSPGATGAGDRLFPGLGNGGYDVRRYALDLAYPSAVPTQSLPGRVRIEATATQALSRFDLDFAGPSVRSVRVDGRRASFVRFGEELVVTPRRPIRDHRRFVTEVTFTGTATLLSPSASVTAAQPNGAHQIFPSDDVPSDPARFTIRAWTPAGSTFVANGELAERRTRRGRTAWRYEMREPMATELIQLAFGALTVRDRGTVGRVHLRDVVAKPVVFAVEPALARVADHLRFMVGEVGRYPFRTYGTLALDANLPFALETQTLSLFSATWFTPIAGTVLGDPRWYEPIMVHELAHQWFGDAVTPARWSDVWLNEGHATWYEAQYAQQRGDPAFYFARLFGPAATDFERAMRAVYAEGDRLRAAGGPVAAPRDAGTLFGPNVYEGGALVLYALRQEVGDRVFREIEREWPRDVGGGPASTEDFIAFASHEAGRDLTTFLRAWLYGTRTPPMPGHPDWEVDPVLATATAPRVALRAGATGSRRALRP